jgi:serine/threonine protein kinase
MNPFLRMSNTIELIEKIESITKWKINPKYFSIHEDSTDWMNIKRGDILRLDNKDFIIRGNMRETRFGIDEQPKMWVFSAIDLDTGNEKILKTEFKEEFFAHIGILKIKCYRSWDKESDVLTAIKGNERFMQGFTLRDANNKNVRVLEYIKGTTFFNYIPSINKNHEKYYYEDLPAILRNLVGSVNAIADLHDLGFIHGDIRNDHIIIESKTGIYRWIDFDLKQDVTDFDMWSIGNIISFAIAKGIITFDQIFKSRKYDEKVKNSLKQDDGSAFYKYRIINLKKIFPYIDDDLNELLMHFSISPSSYYLTIVELLTDLEKIVNKLNK